MNTNKPLFLKPKIKALISAGLAVVSLSSFAQTTTSAPNGMNAQVLAEIQSIYQEKMTWTPIQQKMESQLIHASKLQRGESYAPGAPNLEVDVEIEPDGRVLVELNAMVTPELLALIAQGGGSVINQFPELNAVRALIRVDQLETVAGSADVVTIRRADKAETHIGSVNSQGDTTHAAGTSRTNYAVNGSGIKVGVLSDSADFYSNSIASGDLTGLTILPGQSGIPGSGEGTAMLEIVQDLAPGASLYFATAFAGQASFAQNILNLYSNGCRVIVDDVLYFAESPFQDGLIARAVNTVTTNGCAYFSSASNSGNLDDGTSGTWEGDFVDGGPTVSPIVEVGRLHSFGVTNYNTVASGGSSRRVDLFWSDPLGGATNDYDFFVLNSTATSVLRSSTTRQTGTQDPYEATSTLNIGEKIAIVKFSGINRFLHLSTGRAQLTIATSGSTAGHSAATNAFSVAAVEQATSFPSVFTGGLANPVETFSSDGLRHVFFNADGTSMTPGDYSATGGSIRRKPDLAAADGVSTTVPGFASFHGTSAAAPHAAAIAALALSLNPTLTSAQLRWALTNTTLDIEAAGYDRDAGYGIVMANLALANAGSLLVANDQCASAIVIPPFNYTGGASTVNATTNGDPSPSCIFNFGHGVWYDYTSPASGQIVVDTVGSDFDTGLAIYTGSCGALTQVACDDDSGGGLTSKITLNITAGTTYHILAGGYNAHSGNLVLHVTFVVTTPSLTVNSETRGWYDSTGFHDPGNNNYLAGESTLGAALYRNFFVFNVPTFSGVIASAELLINAYTNVSPAGSETYVLSDVTTPISTLEAGGSGLVSVYNDLGSGSAYASQSVAVSASGTVISIPLNATFLNAAMAAAGGRIALGGYISSLDGTPNNEYCFGYSDVGPASDVQLHLTFARSVSVNPVDRGWYDSTGFHSPGNANYFAGQELGDPNTYRNWFVFNVPTFAGAVVQAELLVNSYTNSSPTGRETYVLRDVTTSIGALIAGGSGLTNIYKDLGDGTVYGSRDVAVVESGQRLIVPLNAAFINAASAVAGSQIALGGSLTSLGPAPSAEALFGFSTGSPADAELRLTFGTSVQVNSSDRGWYDSTGLHNPGNSNYIVGNYFGENYRDWYVFGVPSFPSQLIDAQLLVNSYTNLSPSGVETYQLHEVTTAIPTLEAGGTGLTAIYNDLANGPLYGSRDVSVSESGQLVSIPLNGSFMSAVSARIGSQIALGGSISSLSSIATDESLFVFSNYNLTNDARLWLAFAGLWPASPAFIASPSNLGGGRFRFTLAGSSNANYEIQGSTDLQNWDVARSLLLMTNTTSTFFYTNGGFPVRFFRARLLP